MKAYCHLSIVPVRKSTSDTSEMVNQLLYGEKINILEQVDNWFYIASELDNYQGWVDEKQIKISDKFQTNHMVTNLFYSSQNEHSVKKLYVAGSYLSISDSEKNISLNDLTRLPIERQVEDAVNLGKLFLNAPYLWGGRSYFGIDCSGLTQIVFRLIGINIKRDASEQAEIGRLIQFKDLQNGDLAFFNKGKGSNVTHVGIVQNYNDQVSIIHASGQVKIDKLVEAGIVNINGDLTHHTLFYKRISQ